MHFKRKVVTIVAIGGLLTFGLYTNIYILKNNSGVLHYHRVIDLHGKQLLNATNRLLLNMSYNDEVKSQLCSVYKADGSTLNASKSGLPLLTIFTTLKNTPDRYHIHSNVLKNWALFQPYVKPVLYVTETDPYFIKLAVSLGWEVLPSPENNPYGTPFLKALYQKSKEMFQSHFYGYCNGDLLFEYSLLDTLKVVFESSPEFENTLVIGQRTNFLVANRTAFEPKHVKLLQQTEGVLFQTDAEDYFFMSGHEFPWDKMPNIVVGRLGYDNYFVSKAMEFGYSVVDASETLVALHQTGLDGNYAGHRASKDSLYNYRLIGKDVDISKGVTDLALYKTTLNNNQIEVWHRVTKADPRVYKLKPNVVTPLQYF